MITGENAAVPSPRRAKWIVALLCALGWALIATAPAQAVTEKFEYTGAEQTFVVPSGVHNLQVRLVGGHGGDGGGTGGAAAEVLGSLEVEPGDTLYVEVGGDGEDAGEGGEGGFNGGGNGAGGGGGASDIRTVPRLGFLSLESRLIIAAGGGAGGGNASGFGGNGGEAGSPGATSEGGNEGGGAGTGGEGGGGGLGCGGTGGEGELGVGGGGGFGEAGSNAGGGGGGGLYGGGGGSGGCGAGGGGGGGGSSFIPGFGLETTAVTAPKIEISYKNPPLINISSPVNNASFTLGQSVAANYSCTPQEGTSLKSCAGPVANGAPIDTSTPGPHSFTVATEDNAGGTNSQTVKYTVVSPTPPTAPDTAIGSHPAKKVKTTKNKVKVKFTFSSPTAGATFQCKLDKAPFAPCTSPKRYKVKAGKHKFSVEATKAGLTDPTPATFKFKVVKAS